MNMNEFKQLLLWVLKYPMIVLMLLLIRPVFATNAGSFENQEVNQARRTIKVSGRVVDQHGFPILGATVVVKERKGVGVTTDIDDGKYEIQCYSDETLVYSFVGYITKEEKAIQANNVTIVLEEDVRRWTR